jgi:hypothetical protein
MCSGTYLSVVPAARASRSVKKGITGIAIPNPIITTKRQTKRTIRLPLAEPGTLPVYKDKAAAFVFCINNGRPTPVEPQ